MIQPTRGCAFSFQLMLLFAASAIPVAAQTVLSFEGLGNLQPIGTISGATFSSNWLSINSCTVGGPGNFVNPPSGVGIAFILIGGPGSTGTITFAQPVTSVSTRYADRTSSLTLTAFDATGNVVGTAIGPQTSFTSTGQCGVSDTWGTLSISSPTGPIVSVSLHDAGNFFAIDDFTFSAGCKADVQRLSQGYPRWKGNHYDEIRWITADFLTADTTPVTSSTALELLVGSTPYLISISTGNNTLNGLRDAINALGAGVAASVIPRRNKSGVIVSYYLSVNDTIGAVCQVCGGPAANLQLQTSPGDSTSNILTTKTIQNLGCALTSLSMALNAAALKFKLLGLPSDPDVLNQFMIRRDLPPSNAGDYAAGGWVSFANTTYDVRNNFGANLKWTDARLRCSDTNTCLSSSSLPNVGQYLDDQLCHGLPVVAGVNLDLTGTPGTNRNFGTPSHYVLISGKSGNRYIIVDPGFPKTFLDQYPNFETRGVVSDPVGDISRLEVSVGTPVDLLVSDPNANSTGFNSITGQSIEDIPQSVYLRDSLTDDVTGEASTDTNHSINIFQPSPGSYSVLLTGHILDTYNLTLRGFSQDGTAQDTVVIPGIAGPGSTSIVQLRVSPAPGAPPTVVRLATFQGTLSDINNSLQLGLIDNEGIANSLSQKIQNAQKATGSASADILDAFINELIAQSGKHITGVAVQVLREDVTSLLNQ